VDEAGWRWTQGANQKPATEGPRVKITKDTDGIGSRKRVGLRAAVRDRGRAAGVDPRESCTPIWATRRCSRRARSTCTLPAFFFDKAGVDMVNIEAHAPGGGRVKASDAVDLLIDWV